MIADIQLYCIREAESASSTSSLGLYTPNTPDALFSNNDLHRNNVHYDTTIFSDHDLSTNTFENPAISSMEVELSMGAESFVSFDKFSQNHEFHENPDPITPRRASQVFDFLTEKRGTQHIKDQERSLPELPSAFSFSSNEESPLPEARSRFSSDGSSESAYGHSTTPAIHPPSDDAPVTFLDHITGSSHISSVPYIPPAETLTHDPNQRKLENDIEVIMTAPTKVIVTAPTPSTSRNSPIHRVPRGPRSHSRRVSSRSSQQRRPPLTVHSHSRSNSTASVDPFTPALPRRKSHRRSASQNSSVSISRPTAQPFLEKVRSSGRTGPRSILTELDKENTVGLSAIPQIPTTPLRGKSKSKPSPRDSRSLFRAAVTPGMFRPPPGMTPSPASSSELSPVGRKLMMDLRQQRSKAREAERERGDREGGRSARMSVRG